MFTASVASNRPSVKGSFFAASFMNDWVLERVAGHRPRSDNGYGVLPEGPGLGIEVDLSLLGSPIATFG